MKARIDSLEVLKSFRAALWKFSETSMAALAEAEGEVHRALVWLETEQLIHWQNEIRKRHEWVEKCKEAYRQKTIFKDAAGTRSSGFDERKALDKANHALEEAEEKYANTRKYVRVLQRELQNYTGAVQRFATDVVAGIPVAAAKLEKMHEQLEAYVNVNPATEMGSAASSDESMARGSVEKMGNAAGNPWAQRTPPAEARSGGELVQSANFLMTAQPLIGPQRLGIAVLDAKRTVPGPSQTVSISGGLTHGDHFYLHRTVPVDASDSGWFIGPADMERDNREFARLTVERLLEIRPDFREILALPIDFLVVIGAGTIDHVYNKTGEDVWNKRRS